MTSSSISAHDQLLIDHPFPGIQLVTPTEHDHGDGRHYCHDWVSHHHHQLDQHKEQQVGSSDGLNQVTDTEKGIDQAWAWEQSNDLYDPRIGSADIDDSDDIHDNWVPNSSKLKVVKKMNPKRASSANSAPVVEISTDDFPYFLPADQNDSSSNGNNNNNGIRVCSDCNTNKTPLWRSGPKGPKSLCNACGIRQRKARRALAAAAAAGSGGSYALTKATSCPKSLKTKISNNKEKKTGTTSHNDSTKGWQQPYKKRLKQADHYHQSPYTSLSQDSNPSSCKDADDHQYSTAGERNNNKRICFEEFITISLSKNAALHRVFPQDEKEAAVLLMALSCGLVHN